jgi:hypothetical protein
MKHKLVAVILALTVISWAQTSTQTNPSTPEKSKCACCDKMAVGATDDHAACMRGRHADAKEMASCCTGKEGKSCCEGKDAKSCMKGDKTASSCCKDGYGTDKMASCCDRKGAKGCGKGCCASKSGKTA